MNGDEPLTICFFISLLDLLRTGTFEGQYEKVQVQMKLAIVMRSVETHPNVLLSRYLCCMICLKKFKTDALHVQNELEIRIRIVF